MKAVLFIVGLGLGVVGGLSLKKNLPAKPEQCPDCGQDNFAITLDGYRLICLECDWQES